MELILLEYYINQETSHDIFNLIASLSFLWHILKNILFWSESNNVEFR